MWICSQNPHEIPLKKFIFSKFVGIQRVTWLKMNFFTGIFQGFSEHLSLATSGFTYLCILFRPITTLQCVYYLQLTWIPFNQHKF